MFRATHVKTGQLFAVKVLRARYSRPGADDKRELFRREGELGAQLKHPNIVAIHDVVSQGPLNSSYGRLTVRVSSCGSTADRISTPTDAGS